MFGLEKLKIDLKGFSFWGGFATIGAIVASHLTPGKKAERMRGKQRRLNKEKEELMSGAPSAKKAIRLSTINDELKEINAFFISRES